MGDVAYHVRRLIEITQNGAIAVCQMPAIFANAAA